MQTSNTELPDKTAVEAHGRVSNAIKSFTDLSGALITKEIDAFAEQVRKGIDNWRTAGKILVELSKRQPDIFRLIQARHPHISESTLQTFARIGRNEIWPPLLVDSSLGARKLLECPYDVQKEYADKPIKIAVAWSKGQIKTVERKVSELSRAECAVVFDGSGGINTLDQQAWRLQPQQRQPEKIIIPANAPPQEPKPVRMVNVDLGYFRIVVGKDGKVSCEPCDKSSIAQPVRVIERPDGLRAVIVIYKQEAR